MANVASRPAFPRRFVFKPNQRLLLEQIRQAVAQKIPAGIVLTDAGYGHGMPFRDALTELGLQYVVGIELAQ
jgi:SRSO17 transposase